MALVTFDSIARIPIEGTQTITNVGSRVVYYGGPNVSADLNDGTLNQGDSADFTSPIYLTTVGGAASVDLSDPASDLAGSGSSAGALIPFEQPGTLTVVAGRGRFRAPKALTVVSVAASVNTAPTGASILVDLNKNGTTMFTTQADRPSIAAAAFASAEAVPAVTAIAEGDYLTVDVDQVGSSGPGADLVVVVELA